MRQAVAQSLVLLGFALYEKKSKNMGFLVYLSAPLFHFTALFFFPLLLTFFIRKEFFKVFLPLAWVVSLSFVVSSEPFKFVSSTIFKFVPSVYEHFVVNASFSGSIGAVDFLYQLIFIFIYISFLMRGSAVENRIMLMGMFGVLVSNFLNYSGFVSRVSYFWERFLIAAIPVAIFSVYKSFSRAFLCFIFFSVSSLFYFRAVFVGSNKVTPYYSWLFNF